MNVYSMSKNLGWIIAFWVYFLILLAISIAAYLQALPGSLTQHDKLGHFILLGLAGFLSHQALGRRILKTPWLSLPLGPCLVTGFSLIDEFLQLFSSTRSFDLVDLWSNWIGIWLFYAIAETLRRFKVSQKSAR